MIEHRTWKLRSVCAAVLGVSIFATAGCSGPPVHGDESPAATTGATADDLTVDAPEELGSGDMFGRLVFDSLDDLQLKPAQRQIVEKVRGDVRASMEPVQQARKALMVEVADGVAAGSIDDSKVDAGISKMEQEIQRATPALQDAMNRIHAALDPQQRRALVEGMRARGSALREKAEERGGVRGIVRARLRRLADTLELTPHQRAAIRDNAKAEFRDMRGAFDPEVRQQHAQRMRTIGEAFMTESFDARHLDVGREAPAASRKISTGMTRLVKVVLPELTPDQRSKLAGMIRQRASR